MITLIAQLEISAENAPAFEALLTGVCAEVRAHEPGVIHYAFARSADNPTTYIVLEIYRDAAAHAHHMQTPWVRASLPEAARLMTGKPEIRQYVSPGTIPLQLGGAAG